MELGLTEKDHCSSLRAGEVGMATSKYPTHERFTVSTTAGQPNHQKLPVVHRNPIASPFVIYACLRLGDREQLRAKPNTALSGSSDPAAAQDCLGLIRPRQHLQNPHRLPAPQVASKPPQHSMARNPATPVLHCTQALHPGSMLTGSWGLSPGRSATRVGTPESSCPGARHSVTALPSATRGCKEWEFEEKKPLDT